MRQRRVKNLETKYEEYEDILIRDPAAMKGRWAERADGRPVYVEIGCGKGKFISELAAREPGHFFVAIEGNQSVMLRAMEKIREKDLDNVVFAPEFAEDLSDWFNDGEVRGIYLNFSDPLPKNYWYRRRLTYRSRLQSYFRVLDDNGVNGSIALQFYAENLQFVQLNTDDEYESELSAEIMREIEESGGGSLFDIEDENSDPEE